MSAKLRIQGLSWAIICPVALLCSLTDSAAKASEALPKVITYSVGYRTTAPAPPHNVVELGIITVCGKALCMKFTRYDGGMNLPRAPTELPHEMHAPTRSPRCFDERIATINPSESGQRTVKFSQESDGFLIATDQFQYRWTTDPEVSDSYVLTEIRNATDTIQLDQAVGFAFVSSAPVFGSIKQKQIDTYFNGDIYHKDTLMGVADDWKHQLSSIDFRRFKATPTGETLLLTREGNPKVKKRIGKPIWVQNSIILKRNDDPISPLVQEYGHDFNMNGCFDEFGHNKLLLPVRGDANAIRAFVYIEYSPDKLDGVPMISVGRYYR